MMKYALPGLTLLTVSMFSSFVSAAPATVGSCDASVVQMLKDQVKDANALNTRLSMLLDQQGVAIKQIQEMQKQQEQTNKQLSSLAKSEPVSRSIKTKPLIQQKDNTQFCVPAEPGKTTADGKMILGETEWIYIEEANGTFMSRVDTGATTSSISAKDITVFEREGHRWVKFSIPVDDGKEVHVEAPFVKYIRIRQANGLEDRPIVQMTIRMGTVTEKADFSLTDRTKMDFPVLLGREFIKDIAVVDVARENVQGKPQIAGAVQASEKNTKAEGLEVPADKNDKSDKKDVKKDTKKDTKAKKEIKSSLTANETEQPDFQPATSDNQNQTQKAEVKTAVPVSAKAAEKKAEAAAANTAANATATAPAKKKVVPATDSSNQTTK